MVCREGRIEKERESPLVYFFSLQAVAYLFFLA